MNIDGKIFDFVIIIFYFSVLILLSIYGIHRYLMVHLFRKYRKKNMETGKRFEELPHVTVQLHIYNEMYVVERLIDAVCNIDYPSDRFEVQVLDDSTDQTQHMARHIVERYRNRGIDLQYLRRPNREGFKSGALAFGLSQAKGEFIVVFYADFIPRREMLMQTIP